LNILSLPVAAAVEITAAAVEREGFVLEPDYLLLQELIIQ
jgi:hypothetical protein